jgi:amino acid adenylation domain-containing protein
MLPETASSKPESFPDDLSGDAALPASFAQERLWFLHRLDPGSGSYNVPISFTASGPLDVEILHLSLIQIIQRHEALRTNFAIEDGNLVQVIHEKAELPLELVDLTHLGESNGKAAARTLVSEFARRPFALDSEPLIRVLLIRLSDVSHHFTLNIHHIVFDGSSLEILLRELSAIYPAIAGNQTPLLDAIPIQYGDFAVWQRETFSDSHLDTRLAFWRERLADLPEPLELPERRQPDVGEGTGAEVSFTLDSEAAGHLRKFCQREGVTLFMALMAGAQILLHRYSGQDRMLIGTPVTDRSRREMEHTIGPFLNTVVLRGDMQGDPTGRAFLHRVRDELLGAMTHSDVPFEKVVEAIAHGPRHGRNPLFRTLLVLQEREAAMKLGDVVLRADTIETEGAIVDLLFEIADLGRELHAIIRYAGDSFARTTMERLARHFVSILQALAGSPELRLSELPMLGEDEKRRFAKWNQTERSFPDDVPITSLFEAHAGKAPGKIAIRDGAETVTYAELDSSAEAVAAGLRTRSLARGFRAALPAERSIRFVAAILGILKAGGSYVPIDPSEPADRAAAMRSLCDITLSYGEMQMDGSIAAEGPAASGCDPAYVLFTSGSTGTPKGVVVPHRAISRLVIENDLARIYEDDVIAFASNVCFDAATFEIWGALLNGATLAIFPRDVMLSAAVFERQLAAFRVTTIFLTTSLFNQFAAQSPAMFRSLRTVIFGGEAADAHAVQRVLDAGRPERLVNGYGPTETTTFATFFEITQNDGPTVPIGRPLTNTHAFVLDAHHNEMPLDAAGELHIGGPALALGYLAAPALTASRFIETGFGRLYRTGDRARWREDGMLEYFGRRDSQVKLRGFRIELGEIESELQSHPRIRQAALVVRTDEGRAESLVAYLVANSPQQPDPGELRAFLSTRLPAHMIPAAFHWLGALPLTRNGKLDTRNLPAPTTHESGELPQAIAPRSDLERKIARIWSEVLKRPVESVAQDFFSLGGHSLLALRVLGEIRNSLGIEIPARRLFETPTVEGLAQFASRQMDAGNEINGKFLIRVQRGAPGRHPLFLVPGGWGGEIEFLVYGDLSRQIDPTRPIWGFKARGAGTADPPHATVTEMAAEYIRELRQIQPQGPYWLLGECVGGICAYEMACQLERSGEKVALLVLLDTTVPAENQLMEYMDAESRKHDGEASQFSVRKRIRHHLEQMAGLSLKGKFSYLLSKASGRGKGASAETPAVGNYPRGQKDYPTTLLKHRLLPYGGRVTLILDDESERLYGKLGWESAPVAGIETHTLPGDHITYIRDNARAAAVKLRELLDGADAQFSSHGTTP